MREMSKEEIKTLDKEHVLHSWCVQGALDPTVVAKAEGIYFYDIDGNKYYDMSSQLVNLNIGFGNEKVADAIAEQAHKLPFIGPGYAVDVKSELASRIIELAPDNMSKVFFTLSGALAGAMTVPCHRFCLSPDTGLLVDLPRCVFPFQLLVFAMFLMCFAM